MFQAVPNSPLSRVLAVALFVFAANAHGVAHMGGALCHGSRCIQEGIGGLKQRVEYP